jgi:hypothetical protein
MNVNRSPRNQNARGFTMGCLVAGLLLATSGCTGPLAPTPNFGNEVRAARQAMIANPEGTPNAEEAKQEGLSHRNAKGISENYEYSQEMRRQAERTKQHEAGGIDVDF